MESPEQNMKFLLEAVGLMSKCSSKLVSHYLSHCHKYEGVNDLKLPSSLIRKSSVCKFCGNKWTEGKFRSLLLPRKKAGKKLRKLVRKAEESPYLLRKCEKKMLSMADKIKRNRLVLVCKLCCKKTIISMQVPEPQEEPKPLADEVLKIGSQKKRKKKKKARDLLCGLNPVVLAHMKHSTDASRDTADKSVQENLCINLSAGVVRKKHNLKASQTLSYDKISHALQSEAKRKNFSSNSFEIFLSPVV